MTVILVGVWPRMEVPSERMTEESYAALMEPTTRKFKAEGGSAGGVLVRERGFFGFNRYA